MQSHGHRLKHRGLFERELVGQRVEDACWNRDQLREGTVAPVVPTRDTEHLSVIAEIDLAPLAELAVTAVHGRVKGNAVARLIVFHVRADTLDNSGPLMPHHDGRNTAPGAAIVPMNIATADTAGRHTNQHLVGRADGLRYIRDL